MVSLIFLISLSQSSLGSSASALGGDASSWFPQSVCWYSGQPRQFVWLSTLRTTPTRLLQIPWLAWSVSAIGHSILQYSWIHSSSPLLRILWVISISRFCMILRTRYKTTSLSRLWLYRMITSFRSRGFSSNRELQIHRRNSPLLPSCEGIHSIQLCDIPISHFQPVIFRFFCEPNSSN